jgi:pimeloyl-ACP methyl ester carboxylesterase
MDALELETAVIVGHSMGTTTAQRIAIDLPERMRGIVLLGAIRTWRRIIDVDDLYAGAMALTDPVDDGFVREFQLGTIAQPVPPDYVELVVRESVKLPARVWHAVIEDHLADEAFARIGEITAPTLLIWGDRDSVTPRAEQELLTATIPSSRLFVYDGAGHAVHWEQPERVATDIVAFVNGLES